MAGCPEAGREARESPPGRQALFLFDTKTRETPCRPRFRGAAAGYAHSVPIGYKTRSNPPKMANQDNNLQNDIRTLAEQFEGIRVAMLTTEANDGVLRSRPMMTQETDFKGTLWFFTDEGTAKVSDLYHNRMVNVTYVDARQNRYVSVSGTARIVRDREKLEKHWTPTLQSWFPEGIDDPRVVLMKVTVTEAEYWSSSANAMVRLTSFQDALLTGDRPDVEETDGAYVHPTD